MPAIETLLNVSITTDAFVAVSLGSGQEARSFAARTREGLGWLISAEEAGAVYGTIPAGQSVGAEFSRTLTEGDVLFYAKSASGAQTIEVFLVR